MSCIHIYSLVTREMHTHMHSLEKHAMNTHIQSLETRVIKIICSFSRYTCHEYKHSFSKHRDTHVMNTHIHPLNNHEMNTPIHFSDINDKERETWLQSVKLQSRPTFAQFSRFAWLGRYALLGFTLDPLGTFAPLAGLHRLISCPTTISLINIQFPIPNSS